MNAAELHEALYAEAMLGVAHIDARVDQLRAGREESEGCDDMAACIAATKAVVELLDVKRWLLGRQCARSEAEARRLKGLTGSEGGAS